MKNYLGRKVSSHLKVERLNVDPPSNENMPEDRLISGSVCLKISLETAFMVYEHKFQNKKDTVEAIEEAYRAVGTWASEVAQQSASRADGHQKTSN